MGRSANGLTLLLAVATGACSHAWDDLDPRLGVDGAGGSTGSATASTGSGTASGSASTMGAGATGATGGGGAAGGGQGGSTGSAGSAGSGGGGGPPGCPVDGTSTVTDDFEDGMLAPFWTEGAAAGVLFDETGGEMVIAITPSALSEQYGQIASGRHVFADCHASVHVTETTASDAVSAGLLIAMPGPPYDRIEMSYAAGQIECLYWLNDVATTVGEFPFDPVDDGWWRLRESQGMTYFETSPDGLSFAALAALPTPMPVQSMQVVLFGDAPQGLGTAGEVHFDDVNLPP